MLDFSPEIKSSGSMSGVLADIVVAYVAQNPVSLADVPALIRSVHDALMDIARPASAELTSESARSALPAVPARESITDSHLISLENGKPYRALKRHLRNLGLTPNSYRSKWGLPSDYPMVAPAYARARSALARETGLGRLRREP